MCHVGDIGVEADGAAAVELSALDRAHAPVIYGLACDRLQLWAVLGHEGVKVLAYVPRHRSSTGATVHQDPARTHAT
eukprot:7536235-Alexandrium_andersonii.AAC.1